MASIYMIADTHFYNNGDIIRYEKRPFKDAEKMNHDLIINWNKIITNDDVVWHLGDFSDSSDMEKNKTLLNMLNGHKKLVMGNHDRNRSVAEWMDAGFEEVYPLPVILDDFFILSHEPSYVNLSSPYANIFGHVHGNPAYKDYSSRSYCVCVERINNRPVLLDDIKETIMQEANMADNKVGGSLFCESELKNPANININIGEWIEFRQEGMEPLLHGRVTKKMSTSVQVRCKNNSIRYVRYESILGKCKKPSRKKRG